MRRRDAVLIAILVNAGLLVFLFTLAVTGPEENTRALTMPSQGELVELVPAPSSEASVETPLMLTGHVATPPSTEAVSFETTPAAAVATVSPEPSSETLAVISTPPLPMKTYTVKKGDVLERIAKQHGVTVASLMKANQLKSSSRLSIGQVLNIPSKESTVVAASAHQGIESGKQKAQQIAVKHYTVQKGDNVWAIATKHSLKTEELLKLNKLSPEQARRLQPGDRIRVQ